MLVLRMEKSIPCIPLKSKKQICDKCIRCRVQIQFVLTTARDTPAGNIT